MTYNNDEVIEIGNFSLSRFDDKSFWIQTDDGEGGQFSEEALEAAIAAFYKENF